MQALADIAERYVGTEEVPRGSNRGLVVNRFKAATQLAADGNWPWCAAFVSYCVQLLVRAHGLASIESPPRLARAFDFEAWGRRNNCLIFRPSQCPPYIPQRGDIVIFTFSHVGIVTRAGTRPVVSVDGNTNDEGGREGYKVAVRERGIGSVRCFVRISQRAVKR